MYVIVAGCGRVGSRIAEFLSVERHDVVVIDKDSGAFRRLGGTFNGLTIEGVAFDEDVLLEAGIREADAFVAVTDEDNANLMASEIASNVFKVPTVTSRLYDPQKELTYFKLGLDYICGTTLITERIRERLFQSENSIIVQQDRVDPGVQVVEFVVGDEAAGKPASSLNSGVSSHLLLLIRNNRRVEPVEGATLEKGDLVLMTLRKEGWKVAAECLGSAVEAAACARAGASATSMPAAEETRVIVGGCSMVGSHLAYELSIEGYRVTIIDENPSLFRRLPPGFEGRFLEGVIYDEETLLEAGIEEADAFVSVTKKDNKNLMAAEVSRSVFGVPHVIARLFNPDKEATYQALGMPYVCGTTLLANALLERILKPKIHIKSGCMFNKYNLVEFDSPPAWDGKRLAQASEDTGVKFAYVTRRNTGYMPEDNFVLRAGDVVNALVTTKRLGRLEKNLYKISRR